MRRALVHVLYLLSGAAALVFEIAWMGRLGRTFGSGAEAAAATLAAFFLGLGLGAWFFGRFAPYLRRPLAAWGRLEIGVGAAGAIGWWLPLGWSGPVGPGAGAFAARLFAAAGWIGPAALLMGGTFPVLAEALVERRADLGRRAASLYAVNTLGAALGALAATFALLPTLGTTRTVLGALALAALTGVAALLLARGTGREPTADVPGATRAPRPPLLVLAFLSGFLALGLQVLWTRMFAQALPGSVYVFGTVLVVYLLGLGLAGLVAWALARTRLAPRATLATLLALAGALVAASVPLFVLRTNGLRPPAPGQAWSAYLAEVVLDAGVVLLPAVVALGAVFPYLARAAESGARGAGRAVGALAGANTAGAIFGALAAGFVALPALGLWNAVLGAGALYVVLGLLLARRRTPAIAGVLAAAAVALAATAAPPVVRLDAGQRLLGAWEGPAGTVAVLERDGERTLVVDNVFTLGGTHDARWEALQAHVPLCLHPDPRRVLFLGLGTGITAGAALDHPVGRVVVAEVVPEVIEAARAGFRKETNGLFDDPRVEIVAADARHLLGATCERYDVVIGDLFFPWEAGTANLYTREHFATVRAHLAEGGLFAQWLPCYQMTEEEVLGVTRTFAEVFGRVELWRGDFFADRPLLALVGRASGGPVAADVLVARARSLAGSSGDQLARDAPSIPFHLFAGALERGDGRLARARVLTDDLPWIAWTAPRSERTHKGAGDARLMVGETLLAFETSLEAAGPWPDERRLVEAGLVLRRMAVALHALRRKDHAAALHDYVRLVPARLRPDLGAWVE